MCNKWTINTPFVHNVIQSSTYDERMTVDTWSYLLMDNFVAKLQKEMIFFFTFISFSVFSIQDNHLPDICAFRKKKKTFIFKTRLP